MAEKNDGRIMIFGWVRLSRPQFTLAIIITMYVLSMFWMAKRTYDVFGYQSNETAAMNNVMWFLKHGHPFRFSMIGNESYLAYHAEFFWFLVLPIYALIPGVPTLLFLQALALGLTALPVYLIVRRAWKDEVAGVLMGTAFLFLPAIASGTQNQIHPVPYISVLLLFAYYFFMEKRMTGFVIATLLACLVRENVSIAVAMFGVWAWIDEREWKWRLVPALGGVGYFLFMTQVVMAAMRHGREWHVSARYFTYLGANTSEIIHSILTNPGLVAQHLTEATNLQYLAFLLQPMGLLLPFLSPAALIAMPDLAGNLLSDNDGLKVISWHYQFVTSAGLFMGTVFGNRRLFDWLKRRVGEGNYAPILAGVILCLCLSHWFLWFQPGRLHQLPYQASLERAIAAVPKDKSVLAPSRLTAHLSAREHFECADRIQKSPAYCAQFEYVILDVNERQYTPVISREFFDAFYRNPNYKMIFSETNVFVFQRQGGESDWKIDPE